MSEPRYEVVWPLGKSAYDPIPMARRQPDLAGKTICELWDWAFKGDEVFVIIRELLSKRYPGIKFVDCREFGSIHGAKEREMVATLAGPLREHHCDAVVSALGA
ncbi:MAG: hypothetical protein HYX92_04720 [Chloroflexi bacterium]|nr:hypothetical protein [Chloroflexota bacterium]